jgi:hypothetical protein
MKTIEFETYAENGLVRLPAELGAYQNSKVRITIFVEDKSTQPIENQTNAEKYSKYIDTSNLDFALEGLFAIATSISKTNKEYEALQVSLQAFGKQTIEAMRQAKSGEKSIEESNTIVMETLQKEEETKKEADNKAKELSELAYLKTQIQEVVNRLKIQENIDHTVHQKMPNSSETIDTIERMKSKIIEKEELSRVYEKYKNKNEIDPKVEKEINDILDLEAKRRQEAVEELKKKIGIE